MLKKLLAGFVMTVFTIFPFCLNAKELYKLPQMASMENACITVSVNPQVELISILQMISKYPSVFGFLMAGDTSIYRTEVLKKFEPFCNHGAVRMFDRLSMQPRMLNFSAPSNLMIYTDEFLKLRNDIIMDDFVINRIGGKDSLELFLDLLKDFAVVSSFNDFFDKHREFYLSIINNTINNLGSRDYVSEIENFYGTQQRSYNIILVSLYSGGYGNSILYNDGKRDIFTTIGPKSVSDKVPFFGNESYLKAYIRHEFSHPFVNPLTEKYWNYIKDYAKNYDSLVSARQYMCGDWQECINEFIIRSVVAQLAFDESEELGLQFKNKDKERGVVNIEDLLEAIKVYQSQRGTYKTFESYYLKVLDVMKNVY